MSIIQILEDKDLKSKAEIKGAILRGDSEVQNFYENAVVLITGGSGFLGKQLIEKLFRSCNIKKIYLLLRPRKGKTVVERLITILEDPVFQEIRNGSPNFIQKIVPIEGDSSEIKLGVDDKTWATLADEVNVIFHAAATINFRESIKKATLTNVRGTREILSLAKDCKELKSVVHVSTAYSNATHNRIGGEVKEDFYDIFISPDALIQLAETVDEDKLTAMIDPLIQEWPNSYTFTKAVAEQLIRKESDLPICIVRPAIVISAHREPSLGWVDIKNAFGASGIILGIYLGVTHTLLINREVAVDLVPVDIVNNAIIVAAWATYKRYADRYEETMIYAVTGNRNPVFSIDLIRACNSEQGRSMVPKQTLWYCFQIDTKYKLLYLILTWILHYIPGMVIAGFCLLLGRKPRFFKLYKKAYDISLIFAYFMNNDWKFRDTNTLQLYNTLSDTDKTIYNFDTATVDPQELCFIWAYGVQKFIVKEDFTNREYALRKQFWFKIAHYILFPIYLYTLCKLVFMSFKFTFHIFVYLFTYLHCF